MKSFLIFIFIFSINSYAKENKKILIAYFGKTGKTKQLAESIKKGALEIKNTDVTLYKINQDKNIDVQKFDAIIIGTPVYNAQPAPEVLSFINSWPFAGNPLKDKVGAAFATAGGISAGEEAAQLSLLRSMLIFNMAIIGGPNWRQAFGASAITNDADFKGKDLNKIFLERGRLLGKRVSEYINK